MKKICLLLATLLLVGNSFAQKELSYTEKEVNYVQNQVTRAYALVDSVLLVTPPTTENTLDRRMALMAVDLIVHDKLNDMMPSMFAYMNRRISRVADELEQPVTNGARIFKLYNDSFIVKTASVTVAFDLIPGGVSAAEPFIPDSVMQRLVNACDVLFISHEHGDHANRTVARMFTAQNKPIVAPTSTWNGLSPNVMNLRPEKPTDYTINLSGNRSLKARIIPGHQHPMDNNINHITTPEGIRVMHTGDQYGKGDLEWLARIKESTQTDVLLVNCWTTSPQVLISGVAPKLVIPGHEDELCHTITHREPHWLTWERMAAIDFPKVYMTWGEWFDYIPR